MWPIRRVLFRQDRLRRPVTALPCAPIDPHDGWCDAPGDANYNRPVALPYRASAEPLWREDRIYDLVVVLGYNDDPVAPGAGSAIFLHLARPGYPPTHGCVALAAEDLLEVLRCAGPGSALEIARD
jgi:L,D-peptidoglycan transpeptidase YkuD (ErfK/YbiS/YcfS/YnhG family)